MGDWRKIEQELVDWFKRQSGCPRPQRCMTGSAEQPDGDWIIKIGNGRINVSTLAKEVSHWR